MSRWLALAALTLFSSVSAFAQDISVPVQGYLVDDVSGLPVNGTLDVTFRVYPSEGAVSADYTEAFPALAFSDGRFSAYIGLDGGLDASLFGMSQDRFLGITIGGGVEMPRVRMGFVPYAAYAANAASAESVDGYGSADFLPSSYQPSWSEITGVPPELLDGDDVGQGTTYTAGSGILIDPNTNSISLNDASVQGLARGVCFDTVAELRSSLDAIYLVPAAWSAITGMPAGFSDGIDDVLSANAVLGIVEGASSLDLPPTTTIGGEAPYSDADVADYLSSNYPELGSPLGRNPLMVMGTVDSGCTAINNAQSGFTARFETNFSEPPVVITHIDETNNNSGAEWTRLEKVLRNRMYVRCDNYSDSVNYVAIEPGVHTIDGKVVQAGTQASIASNGTVFFPETFAAPPVVLLQTGGSNAWVFISGAGQVTTQGFQVTVSTNNQPLHWIAFTPGEYNYGPYHFEARLATGVANNNRYAYANTFQSEPWVLTTPGDTSTSGTNYVRTIDATLSDFQIRTNNNNAEFLNYVAFEVLR